MKKSAGGVETLFFYDRAGRLIAEMNSASPLKREYVWLEDLPLFVVRGFIAKKNPSAARTIIHELRTSIRHLAEHPSIGTQLGPLGGLR